MNLEAIRDIDQVFVFKSDSLAGVLTRTVEGSIFSYDDSYLEKARNDLRKSIAFTLPLSQKSHATRGDNLHPFFAGLLPEGLRLTALISAVKTSADDMFSLLAASGTDCIGDVSVSLSPELPQGGSSSPADLDTVSFADLFTQSIGATEYTERLNDISIPGVHPKVSGQMISFPLALKKRDKRYILKLAPEPFPLLVENEHFFMSMAKECGLNTAAATVVHDNTGAAGLLVERFDRMFDKERERISRLHLEDACQFLGRYPQDKYRLSLRQVAEGARQYCTSPAVEILRLLELVAFSYIVANGDLHAKNVSVLTDSHSGRITLSPAYDLVSTLPYGDLNMALKFEGRTDNLKTKDFLEFAEHEGVRPAAVRSMLKRLGEKAAPWVERLSEIGLDAQKTDFLRRTMTKRLKELRV